MGKALLHIRKLLLKLTCPLISWHRDIKPDNILVYQCPLGDPILTSYNHLLKLGDLGTSCFKTFRKIRGKVEDEDKDTSSSRVYGRLTASTSVREAADAL